MKNSKSIITLGLYIILTALLIIELLRGNNYSILPLLITVGIMVISYLNSKASQKKLKDIYSEIYSLIGNYIFTPSTNPEIYKNSIAALETRLSQTIQFIQTISKGEKDNLFAHLTEEERKLNQHNLVGELISMEQKMQLIAQEENERTWVSQGIAKFSEIFREQNKSLEETLDHFIIEFSKYISCNQASLFILDEAAEPKLKLISCYAFNRKKYLTKEVAPGEGLVGQVFLEQQSVYLKKVPENYIRITSGLGDAPPRVIYIVPLKVNDKIEGVLELASFQEWKGFQKSFIERIAEIVGSAISSIKLNEKTAALLTESRSKEAILKSQEEELRQNLEELHATQEEIQRKSNEAYQQNSKLTAILDSTVNPVITINERGLIETVNKATLELFGYSEAELINQNVRILMTEPNHSQHDKYLHNYKTTGIKKIIGKLRKSEARKKDGSTFPIEIAVNEADLGNRKIFTGIIRDISERENFEHEQTQLIEELRAQEEELNQNMEELNATQDEINRQLKATAHLNREMDARMKVLNQSTILSESDLFGNIIFANKKFCEVSQYSVEELIGKPHNLVRHPDMPKEVFKAMWETIKAGAVFRGIVKNRKKNGEPYYVDAIIAPVLDEDGKPEKYIGARYVIEEIELAERLLKKQNASFNEARNG